MVVFLSLFIYTAAFCLSKPSTVDHRYGVAVVSGRNHFIKQIFLNPTKITFAKQTDLSDNGKIKQSLT